MEKLTKESGKELGFHRVSVDRLIGRGAVVIEGEIFAPIKRRPSRAKKQNKEK